MHISDFAIANPVKVVVGVILVGMFGLIALLGIPVQMTPEVTRPVVSVRTEWPGAGPQEIENDIISKQEEQLQDIEGMVDFRSTCTDGRGEIVMEFKVGTDINSTLLRVSNRLDQVKDYPPDADEPVLRTSSASSNAIAYLRLMAMPPSRQQLRAFRDAHPEVAKPIDALLARDTIETVQVYALAKRYPVVNELIKNDPKVLNMLRFAQDVVATRVANVTGVSEAEIYGGSELELRVIIDPARLAAHQITIEQLRAALVAQNADVSGGDIWEGKRRYTVRTLGQFYTPEDVENVIVTYRDGAPVYVKALASVRLMNSKTQGMGRQRGVDSLTLAVRRTEGTNVLEVMNGVMAVVKDLNESVLPAMRLRLVSGYDETQYIRSATRLVRNNIFIGGALAVGVLLLFLRSGRTTFIIALAIPICCLGTFLIIRLLGRSINVISLAGMSFAIGMVVDAAIVVLENIYSHYQRGERPFAAARQGTSEVWGAILASTLTTLAVFLPVIFIEEEAGQLFRDIAIAISAGVSISLIVSLTVIPSGAARLLRERELHHKSATRDGRLDRAARAVNEAIVSLTERLQAGRINNPAMVAMVILFAFGALCLVPLEAAGSGPWPDQLPRPNFLWLAGAAVAIVLFAALAFRARRAAVVLTMTVLSLGLSYRLMLPADYLPEGNKNLVNGNLDLPAGYNIDQMMAIGKIIEGRLQPYWEAQPGSPEEAALDGPCIEDFYFVAYAGRTFMGARAADPDRASELVPVLRRATDGIPGVTAFISQSGLFERHSTGGRNIEIEISGPELDKLVSIARRITGEVRRMYSPEETESSVETSPKLDMQNPELHIRRNAEKAAESGVSNVELGYAINALVDGAYAGRFWHQGKEIDLKIYGADEFSSRTQDVAKLPIGTPGGKLVSISDVADVVLTAGPDTIQRIDRVRAFIVRLRPGPGIALEEAMQRIDAEILQPIRDSGELEGVYHLNLAGTADSLRQMRAALSGSMILALIITFLLIAALYESFIYPLVIMISVPMAAVGGFAALRLQYLYSGQRLDTLTMLGFIILIGTVVNNAILIVDQALNYIRRDGWHHRDAVTESVRGRIRPIFMSTLTTVLGMLPLVLLPGAGSELYRGLGSVVVGGLFISTVFTLFLVPILFTLTFELRERFWERGRQDRRRAVTTPAPRLATAGAPLPSPPLENSPSARSVARKTTDEQ
jgi:hydrophobic/amphiphilic exporter-1 (mainly G- bacteria), HAE1 family